MAPWDQSSRRYPVPGRSANMVLTRDDLHAATRMRGTLRGVHSGRAGGCPRLDLPPLIFGQFDGLHPGSAADVKDTRLFLQSGQERHRLGGWTGLSPGPPRGDIPVQFEENIHLTLSCPIQMQLWQYPRRSFCASLSRRKTQDLPAHKTAARAPQRKVNSPPRIL